MDTIEKEKLLESHLFWYKNRFYFNILIAISGLLGLLVANPLSLLISNWIFVLIGILLWAIVANGLYSLGFVIESFIIHKTKGLENLPISRVLLLFIGTISYIIISFLYPFLIFL
ncbi:MAG: hypothetical protein R2801_01790 [Chitinophagales bacterium]